jgi:hypothetical protein
MPVDFGVQRWRPHSEGELRSTPVTNHLIKPPDFLDRSEILSARLTPLEAGLLSDAGVPWCPTADESRREDRNANARLMRIRRAFARLMGLGLVRYGHDNERLPVIERTELGTEWINHWGRSSRAVNVVHAGKKSAKREIFWYRRITQKTSGTTTHSDRRGGLAVQAKPDLSTQPSFPMGTSQQSR